MYTTVRLSEKTKAEIESLKGHKRETIEDVVHKLLSLVPEGDDEGKYTTEFRAGLLDALIESKNAKGMPLEQVKKELGL